jgi:hypothetical protein
MTRTAPAVRITGTPEAKAKHACMVGSHELRLFTYMQPYDLRRRSQVDALRALYESEFKRPAPAGIDSPGDDPVRYLIILDGEPILLPQNEAAPTIFGMAIAKLGWEAGIKVLHREDLLS